MLKIICGAIVVLLMSCASDKTEVTLRVGHTLDTQHSVHQAMAYMGERLAYYSDGQMNMKLYPNGQLGAEREMVELLQIGSLAMTKVSAATLEGFVEDMRLFGLPYVFQSRKQRWDILESQIGEDILLSLQSAHLRGLGYFDAGSRSFYTCDKELSQPGDLRGMKIRVMNSQNAVKMVSAFGGSATPISWGELYAALQQRVVDGAENNPPSFFISRHYEICKYYTLNEHTAVPDVIIVSQHIFDNLTPQQQDWLKRAMSDAVTKQKELWLASENDALAAIKAAGVKVVYPDKTPFINAVSHLHDSYAGTKVGEYLQRIDELNARQTQ